MSEQARIREAVALIDGYLSDEDWQGFPDACDALANVRKWLTEPLPSAPLRDSTQTRTVAEILATGAAWVTEAELVRLGEELAAAHRAGRHRG